MIPRLNSARFAFWYAQSWLMRRWSGTTQSDEAAILGRLTENAPYRTFVEFGFHPLEFNCIRLAADPSWRGLVVDADATMIAKLKENASLGNTQAAHSFLTLENLDIILGQFDHLGVLSIDVDGNDYWFLKAMIDLSPSIICVMAPIIASSTFFGNRSRRAMGRGQKPGFDYCLRGLRIFHTRDAR